MPSEARLFSAFLGFFGGGAVVLGWLPPPSLVKNDVIVPDIDSNCCFLLFSEKNKKRLLV